LILNNDLEFSIFFLFDDCGKWSLYNINLSHFQIIDEIIYHISIKCSQIIASSHQTYIITHSMQKSGYLHSNVPSPNYKSFSWSLLFHKYIITGYSMMWSFNLQIRRTSSRCYHKIFSFYLVVNRTVCIIFRKNTSFDKLMNYSRIFGAYYSIFIFKSSKTIKIIHIVNFIYTGNIPKINRFYITLNFTSKLCPVKLFRQLFWILSVICTFWQLPSIIISID